MNSSLEPEIAEKIKLLKKKFNSSGENLGAYLDGLLHSKFLTYWDYIHLDTLLSLQQPKTNFADEEIFITYHQISELYFKLIIHELKQITESKNLTVDNFIKRITRINRYFETLIDSFDIMVYGMDKEQFMQYRMSLIPASGFQSVQFRMIEIYATPLCNILSIDRRNKFSSKSPVEDTYESLYWKRGATNLSTGAKTLTLIQFEERYTKQLKELSQSMYGNSLYFCYKKLSKEEQQNPKLIDVLKRFDKLVNVEWSLSHLKAAHKHLSTKKGKHVSATGGTNWKNFLPPSYQRISFFPFLWTKEERTNWAHDWIMELINA